MTVLLDTHALLWAKMTPALLSARASKVLADMGNEVLVSAATAWEVATKVRLGKLPGAEVMERDFLKMIVDSGYSMLPIDVATALRAGRLRGEHRDPFDRMLAAQALALDIPIVSADAKLDFFPIERLW